LLFRAEDVSLDFDVILQISLKGGRLYKSTCVCPGSLSCSDFAGRTFLGKAILPGYIPLVLVALLLVWISKLGVSLFRNTAVAKAFGIPYAISCELFHTHDCMGTLLIISAIDGIDGFLWTALHGPILKTLEPLPFSRDWEWLM
jgi:hypothetical protein